MSNVIPLCSPNDRARQIEVKMRKDRATAWDQLQRARKLSPPDRRTLAKSLHEAISAAGLGKIVVAERAGFEDGEGRMRP
jgi:hypothetical protein